MEHNVSILYVGGEIKFIRAGEFKDESGQVKTYDDKVKIYQGSRGDVSLSLEAVRALYEGIRNSSDLQVFIGV